MIQNQNTCFEEELISYAAFKVLEKDTADKEQFLELMGLSYMLMGITENFRLLIEDAENETMKESGTF